MTKKKKKNFFALLLITFENEILFHKWKDNEERKLC